MEDAHRTHKETPFGWAAWLSELISRPAQRRGPWSDPPPPPPTDDLRHFSGPR
jgi:hypothetical protein